jgi:signal transduction histidine kinase
LRPAAAQKNTQIAVQLLSDFPPLRGDPFRLGQILQNFISNAIKFTEDGTVTLEAEMQQIKGDQAEIEFRVIDSGIGILEADQDRIFDDFVMVDPSFGRTGEGTGLGLGISRRLARAMDGEVGVESPWGGGQLFLAARAVDRCGRCCGKPRGDACLQFARPQSSCAAAGRGHQRRAGYFGGRG